MIMIILILIIIAKNIYIYITTDLIFFFFTYVHFLEVDNLRANTTSAWSPCPFPNFVFEMYKEFWFL